MTKSISLIISRGLNEEIKIFFIQLEMQIENSIKYLFPSIL